MNVDRERLEKGLYWQRAWKLVEGCTKVSPGCENCWSETETAMRSGHPNKKISTRAKNALTSCDSNAARYKEFNGHITMREDNLDLPLRIKKPTVFAIWNDLFHIDVGCDFINKAYDTMVQCPQHTFLILTKRAAAMFSYIKFAITEDSKHTPVWTQRCTDEEGDFVFPYNIRHGVTVCNQEEAVHKIPYLLQVPGKRFLSVEPMLGQIDLQRIQVQGAARNIDFTNCLSGNTISEYSERAHNNVSGGPSIDQVLLGGESGKNARPMHPDWVRTIRDQCAEAGVPFMFKQWGEWLVSDVEENCRHIMHQFPKAPQVGACGGRGVAFKLGKKKAGRILDGKIHAELIWT